MKTISSNHLILIVEDSDIDYETTLRAFKKSNMANPIHRCEDGEEALDYLHRRNQYSEAESSPRPDIILLDLNLPGTDGRDVLEEIKKDPKLRSIPVIVLTTSADDKDINKCYQVGANSYIQKPVDLQGFLLAIQRLNEFWFEVVLLPKQQQPK